MRGLPFVLAVAACASVLAAPRPEHRRSSWSELAAGHDTAAGADVKPDGLSPELGVGSTAADVHLLAHAAAHIGEPSGSLSAGQQHLAGGAERRRHIEEQWHVASGSLGPERAQLLRAAVALHDKTTPSMAGMWHQFSPAIVVALALALAPRPPHPHTTVDKRGVNAQI